MAWDDSVVFNTEERRTMRKDKTGEGNQGEMKGSNSHKKLECRRVSNPK